MANLILELAQKTSSPSQFKLEKQQCKGKITHIRVTKLLLELLEFPFLFKRFPLRNFRQWLVTIIEMTPRLKRSRIFFFPEYDIKQENDESKVY